MAFSVVKRKSIYIYTTLKFLALQGAPYIYDISRLRDKPEFSRQFFEKHSNIKRHYNLSSGSRLVIRGQSDGRTDMAKLIVAF
jgi:hypothetical protein